MRGVSAPLADRPISTLDSTGHLGMMPAMRKTSIPFILASLVACGEGLPVIAVEEVGISDPEMWEQPGHVPQETIRFAGTTRLIGVTCAFGAEWTCEDGTVARCTQKTDHAVVDRWECELGCGSEPGTCRSHAQMCGTYMHCADHTTDVAHEYDYCRVTDGQTHVLDKTRCVVMVDGVPQGTHRCGEDHDVPVPASAMVSSIYGECALTLNGKSAGWVVP